MCFVSSLYVGSISDVELTRESGLIRVLESKPNISVMAEHGLTIYDQLTAVNVELNNHSLWKDKHNFPLIKFLRDRR